MTFLIIDTNVCLHFTSFDQYPWETLTKGKDDIIIVITHPLIEELDKKKYSGKNHLKERATRTLKLIEKCESIDLENGCKAVIFNENVNKSYLDSLGLDIADGDDKLIAAVVKFKEEDSNKKVFFVTNDLGPRLKARKFGVESLIPASKHALKTPENELEKSIKSLKRENERFKNRIPKLSITFQDEQNLAKFKLREFLQTKEEFIRQEMLNIKEKHKRFKLKDEIEKEKELEKLKDDSIGRMLAQNDNFRELIKNLNWRENICEERKEMYNSKLTTFYSDYKRHLHELYDYEKVKSLRIELNFYLNNYGNIPAEDIDIYFHFPDGFQLFDEKKYPEKPEQPLPPYKPSSTFDIPTLNVPLLVGLGNHSNEKPNISGLSIKKTNSYDVDIHVRKLKHNKRAMLNKMFVLFGSYEEIINFRVDYQIICSNVPDVVEGKLNVVIEKED